MILLGVFCYLFAQKPQEVVDTNRMFLYTKYIGCATPKGEILGAVKGRTMKGKQLKSAIKKMEKLSPKGNSCHCHVKSNGNVLEVAHELADKMEMAFQCECHKMPAVMVDLDSLSQALCSMPEEFNGALHASFNGDFLHFECQGACASVETLNEPVGASQYPEDFESLLDIPKGFMPFLHDAASQNEFGFSINGLLFDANFAVATDGHRLHCRRYPKDSWARDPRRFVINFSQRKKIKSLFGSRGFQVSIAGDCLRFSDGNVSLFTREDKDLRFPPIEKIVNKNLQYETSFLAGSLLQAISGPAKGKGDGIKMEINGRITIMADNYRAHVDTIKSSKEMILGINPVYLKDALSKAKKREKATMRYESQYDQVSIEMDDKMAIIMTMRL